MAQQKIILSRLKKVLSSSTSSLAPAPASARHSRRIEITLNPYFRFEWPQSQPQPQPPQYQNIFHNQSASNVSVHRCVQHYPYAKDQLLTRSLTDLRVPHFSNGRVIKVKILKNNYKQNLLLCWLSKLILVFN